MLGEKDPEKSQIVDGQNYHPELDPEFDVSMNTKFGNPEIAIQKLHCLLEIVHYYMLLQTIVLYTTTHHHALLCHYLLLPYVFATYVWYITIFVIAHDHALLHVIITCCHAL